MNVGDLGRIPMSAQLASTLARAAGYADAQAHIEVTLEHLLLALLEDQDAGNVLRSSRVEAARLAGEVSTHLGRIEERRAPGVNAGVAISQDLRRILEAAAAAARQGRRREIDGAIVLAAIVGDGKSTAAHLLRAEGLTFEEAIRALQRATAAPGLPQAQPQQPQQQPRGDVDPRGGTEQLPDPRASTDELIATARERIQTRTATPSAATATAATAAASAAAAAAASQAARAEPTRPAPPEVRPASNFEPQWQPANLPPGPRPAPQPTIVDQPQMPLPPEHRPAPQQPSLQPPAPVAQPQTYARPPEPQPLPPQQAPSAAPPPGYGGPPPATFQAPQQPRESLPQQGFDRSFGSPPPSARPEAAVPDQRPMAPPVYAPLPPGSPPQPGPPAGFPPPQQGTQQPPRRVEPALPQGGFPPDSRAQPSGLPPQQMPPPGGAPPRPQQGAMPTLSAGPPPQHQPREPVNAPRSGPPPGAPPHQAGHPPPAGGAPSQSAPSVPPGQQAPPPQRARTVAPPQNVRVAAGQLVENIPRKMRVGMALVVEARVARAEVKAIAEGLQGGGAVYRHELTVTKAMSVRLRAPDGGFYIENASPETQWIDNVLGLMADDYASWRWTITPTERGKRRLQLLVSARTVGADGLAAETALPDQMIEVKVAVNYAATFARLGGWLVAAVAGGLLARFGEGLIDPLRKLIGF